MLFKRAEVTSAFLKMGLMGFAGSGKTYTATMTAIGLIHYMREQGVDASKPLFFLDTETGSDWVKPQIEAADIELHTAKTRAFSDLLMATKEAERGASILLVDSISHFWTELCEAYMKRKNRTRLQFEDWSYLKGEWRKFTDLFINSGVHVIICGRAGYEYDYFENEDTGKKQLEKTGIKMKAESEMGYEPSLLVLMEREMDMETTKVHRHATVLKDRSTLIDGKVFKNPTVDSFMPHIRFLNLGGKQLGVDTSRNSEHTIAQDHRDNSRVQRDIVLEEIESLLVRYYPGQAAADKQMKAKLVKDHFGSSSWTELSKVMSLPDLRKGYDALHRALEGEPSRYTDRDGKDAATEAAELFPDQQSDNPAEGMAAA